MENGLATNLSAMIALFFFVFSFRRLKTINWCIEFENFCNASDAMAIGNIIYGLSIQKKFDFEEAIHKVLDSILIQSF